MLIDLHNKRKTMKVVTFDVETTGLNPKHVSTRDTYRFPYVVQLSWIVFDTGTNTLEAVYDYIIRLPQDMEIPDESTSIHGINTETMREKGVDIRNILEKFKKDVLSATVIVAHNIAFDKKILEVEFFRNGFKKSWNEMRKKEFCTMKEGENMCNLKMKSFYTGKMISKYPRLSELHQKLFRKTPKNIHNSLIDILMCFRCYYKMYYDRDIMTINTKFASLYKLMCVL